MDAQAKPEPVDGPDGSQRILASRAGLHLPNDRFIPVRSEDLVEAILEQSDRFPQVTDHMEALCREMDRVIVQETTAFQRFIGRRYDAVNPARETKAVRPAPNDAALAELQQMLGYLIEKANYEHLDKAEIEATIKAAKSHGMQIRTDPDRLERLELYVRGQAEQEQRKRSIRSPIRGKKRVVEVFQRLVVVFQFKGEPTLNLKLFRDIPVADVEALLPHAEAVMSLFDRFKVAAGSAGAFGGIAWKIAAGTAIFGQLAWAGIVALCGLSIRAFFGYRRARHTRASQMTHNLYYRIVANNAGVLELLLGSIGQEELKEAVLGYTLLLHRPDLTTDTDLEVAASQWLKETFGVTVDFDARDAIETLDRFELWADRDQLVPVSPAQAHQRLTVHWRDAASERYHIESWTHP
ncbi:MAG: DUF3754 domain-containing protein [Nannocystaceae bacterium]|nr:DUF3754 domain-containing protein [Nannocystaceae bacterium]